MPNNSACDIGIFVRLMHWPLIMLSLLYLFFILKYDMMSIKWNLDGGVTFVSSSKYNHILKVLLINVLPPSPNVFWNMILDTKKRKFTFM